jgi:hypothetical protein
MNMDGLRPCGRAKVLASEVPEVPEKKGSKTNKSSEAAAQPNGQATLKSQAVVDARAQEPGAAWVLGITQRSPEADGCGATTGAALILPYLLITRS